MVKSQHRVLSVLLCLILAVSALCVGTAQAFAATGDTVYVKANNGWTNLHCYMWTGNTSNAAWPGVTMTKVADDVYSYTLNGDYENVIFNNSNNGSGQTSELKYAGNGKIYDLSSRSWSTYAEPVTDPTSATGGQETTDPTTAPATTAPVGGDGTLVYLKNDANWSTPCCYAWNGSSDSNASWPGVKMTEIGDGYWMYRASNEYKNCIFSNSGNPQTGDLTVKNGYYYNNSKDSWEGVYDTSPLQVISYTADPATGIYTGTDVTLSASAKNSDNTAIYYKFSVTNASGATSVVSNFSTASSVKWTPTTAGTYTITFDFKDAAGNENSRTLSLKVEDDTDLVKPIIKSVNPANHNSIKVNTPATVTVNAGGGKTGTNLLFYKYVVTDPNGVKNTPYYTLSKTYKFKPSVVGKYTVDVYVQSSDNSTVSKTYEYNAISGDIPETTAVVPTTTQEVTTVPTTAPVTTAPVTTAPVTTAPVTEPTTTGKILGDVNRDGRLTIADSTCIQKYIANNSQYLDIDLEVADVNNDGIVNIKDATTIQRILVHS